MREAVGIFDVSHLGKAMVSGPGAAGVRQRDAEQRPRPDRPGQGAVHAVLRRRDRRHRRRPDRLPPRRRARAAGPQRRQHRRGRRAGSRRQAPEGVTVADHHTSYAVLAVQGTQSDEVLDGGRAARRATTTCPSSRPTSTDTGVVVCRTGYTGERGYELIAAQRRCAGALWDALLAAGEEHGIAAVRPRRPRHAAHRDGLPAARPGHQPRRHAQPGPARLGGRLEEGARSGAATSLVAEKEAGPERMLRGLVAAGRGIPRPGMQVMLAPDVAARRDHLRHVLARPCARASAWRCCRPSGRGRGRGAGRRPRPPRGLPLTKPPFVDPSVRESVNLPEQPPTFRQPIAAERPVVVAARGRRRRGGRAVPRTSPASASPPRPTPSRGSARSGPTSPTRASPRSPCSRATAQVYGPMPLDTQ